MNVIKPGPCEHGRCTNQGAWLRSLTRMNGWVSGCEIHAWILQRKP